ncbi:MAG: addiction module protein [Pyrinomonadaceae bacterium]
MNTQVAEILELSVAEKIQIVEDIWDSIIRNPEKLPLSETEKKELDKRLADYEQNPDDGIEWETLKNNILQIK